jgi:hypothetical protein
MPILWIEEGSSFASGVSQDLYAGGFYQTVNGKRTVKPAKDLSPPLQGHVAYMISEYQKEGITEFAVAPYSFGWGNTMVNPKLAAPLRGRNTDLRDRWLVVTPPDDGKLRAYSPEQIAQILTQTHPEIWPKGRVWQANPDQVATDANHMVVDTPDDVTLKRDSAYYTFYLYALKAQFPAVTRVIGQLSNCVYNRRDDSPHWAIARSMMTSNQTFGYPADIQIEGCTSKASTDAGKPWNTPVADCRAAKAIKAFTGPSIVSMWHSDIKSGLQLDYRSCP